VAGQFADGVWLAALATVRDPAAVAAAVAAALGVRDRFGVSAADMLARVLARRQLLLLLDNWLLSAADDVRILATSREPLRMAAETRFRLAPLPLPGPGDGAGGVRCAAVELFADRARRVNARFSLDGETGVAVARLVRRLDGVPLAIELAAARSEAAVAGAGAVPAVLRLVDCSLLAPPAAGPDGRPRYVLLETLRAYGPRRAATGGAPPSSGSACRRCFWPTSPARLTISPRCATPGRPRRRPERLSTAWPAGREPCSTRVGSTRQQKRAAARWPWHGRSATRPARRMP
jgi:hypothetical protein